MDKLNPFIGEMVQRITKFSPQKVILFGSHARGTAGPDSDVDLLVIMNLTKPRRKQATEIDLALAGIPLPADIVVVTPQEVDRNREQIGTIVYPALKEGKVLYEKI